MGMGLVSRLLCGRHTQSPLALKIIAKKNLNPGSTALYTVTLTMNGVTFHCGSGAGSFKALNSALVVSSNSVTKPNNILVVCISCTTFHSVWSVSRLCKMLWELVGVLTHQGNNNCHGPLDMEAIGVVVVGNGGGGGQW